MLRNVTQNGLDSYGSGQQPLARSFERGSERAVPLERGEFLALVTEQ